MSTSAEAIKSFLNNGGKKEILSKANVVGYSSAPAKRMVDGKETNELCFRVYVSKKRGKLDLNAKDLIPEDIGGLPTDVVEIGVIRALSARPQEYKERMRPCPPGYSIGHVAITAGTFGVNVKDTPTGEKPLILSNNHVLANQNNASPGDHELQPGKYDGGVDPADELATLLRFVTITIGGSSTCPIGNGVCAILNGIYALCGRKTRFKAVIEASALTNKVDCAIARPINPADISYEVKDIGVPSGVVVLKVGDKVHKTGRTTQHTHLIVNDVNYTGSVQYTGGIAVFEDQVLMVGDGMAGSAGGDSGSAIFLADGPGTLLGALLFAGSDTQNITIGNKIQNIFAELSVELAIE